MESDENFHIPISVLESYRITKSGQIWSTKTNKYLKTKLQNGYYTINLEGTGFAIHRLLALTFLPRVEGKEYINHINENKTDNRLENLEWVTQKENTERHSKCISHPRKVIKFSKNGEILGEYSSLTEAGASCNVTRHAIRLVCNGKNKSAGGFIWKYEDGKVKSMTPNLSQTIQIKDFPTYNIFSNGDVYNTKTKTFLKPVENAAGNSYYTFCNNGSKKNIYLSNLLNLHNKLFVPS